MVLGGLVRRRGAISAIVAVQAICALYFVSNILLSLLGIPVPPIPWAIREYLEIGAAFGMVLGVAFGAILLQRTADQRQRAEEGLRRVRGEFRDHLEERFARWGLTPAEAEVAIYAIKGLRTQEIADLRKTSEGTVKAQTNAIYRKARVSGRSQLLSLFIEDLIVDVALPPAAEPAHRIARVA